MSRTRGFSVSDQRITMTGGQDRPHADRGMIALMSSDDRSKAASKRRKSGATPRGEGAAQRRELRQEQEESERMNAYVMQYFSPTAPRRARAGHCPIQHREATDRRIIADR